MSAITHPFDRRNFLKTGLAGAAGLVVGVWSLALKSISSIGTRYAKGPTTTAITITTRTAAPKVAR